MPESPPPFIDDIDDADLDTEAYYISRGVRPMFLLQGTPSGIDSITYWGKRLADACHPYNGGSEETAPYPFVITGIGHEHAHAGIAAYPWVIEALRAIIDHVDPPPHQHLLGLLLGYSPAAINEFDQRNRRLERSRPPLEDQ